MLTYTVTPEQAQKIIAELVSKGFKVITDPAGGQSVELKEFGAHVMGWYTPGKNSILVDVMHQPWMGHGDLDAFTEECDAEIRKFLV